VNNPVFKSVLDDVHDRVRAGSSLSEAFEAHGSLFPGVYTASLMAGEKSGSLEQVIRRYVAYVKVIAGVRRKTISALVYPTILLVLSLGVVSLIVLRVVPEFALFYEGFDRELPMSTRAIVAISKLATTYFVWIALALIAVGVAAWLWLKQPGQRRRFDRWILRLPALGPVARKFATSQAARTLATLLGGGIPLVNAIEVSARAIKNQFIARELLTAAQKVREGQALASAMDESGAFPDVAIKMVEVGESTGALQDMLNSLAEFYDEEIETDVERVTRLIEPVLLVVMGAIIALVVLAMYMPLFDLSSVVGT